MVSFSLTNFYPNPPKPNRRFSAPSKHKYSNSHYQYPMATSTTTSPCSSLSSSSPLSAERTLPKHAFVTNLRPMFDVEQLFSILLFIVWCAANSAYATDAHSLLHDSSHEHLYVELTLFQILVSVAIVLPFVPQPYIVPSIGNRSTYISACHFLGALLSNSSYAILGATSTLVWKLSEPFATVIFKITIQKERVLPLRITGIAIVVVGVLTFSGFNLSNSLMFSPIFLANIAFPLRNVLMKLTQVNKYGGACAISNKLPYNPQRAFLNMQVHALPYALCALLIKWCIAPTIPMSVIPHLIRNSLYFSLYQMASIALLARLDSLTHAVANLFKRFSSIFVTALFIRTGDILPRHIVGIILMFIGFPLYALSGFIDAHSKLKTRLNTAGKPFLFVMMGMVIFIAGFSSRPTIEGSYSAYQTIQQAPSGYVGDSAKIPDWVRHPRELFPTEDGVERTLKTLAQIDSWPINKNRRGHVVYQTYNFDIHHMSNDNYGSKYWQPRLHGGRIFCGHIHS